MTARQTVEFGGLDITIIAPRDEAAAFLTRELQLLGARTRNILPSVEALPNDADVVYCDYDPGLPYRTPRATHEGKTLVVIVPQTEAISADALAAASPQAVLARPFTANAILASLVVARSQSAYQGRLLGKIESLEENLRAHPRSSASG